MLKKEIAGVIKDRRACIFIAAILLLMLADAAMAYSQYNVPDLRSREEEIKALDEMYLKEAEEKGYHWVTAWIIHPACASYLSGVTHGQLPQILIIWLMPLYVLNIYSDKSISEYNRGYVNGMLIRTGKRKYISRKIVVSFIIPFVIMAVCLFVNFGITQIAFHGGYGFRGAEYAVKNSWTSFIYSHPNVTYCIYILLSSLAAGCCGVICQCLSLIFKKYTTVYAVSFFVWLVLMIIRYSVTDIFQPFSSSDFKPERIAGLILLSVTIVMLMVTIIIKKIKKDEL